MAQQLKAHGSTDTDPAAAAGQDPSYPTEQIPGQWAVPQWCQKDAVLSAPGQSLKACRGCLGMLSLACQLMGALEPPAAPARII